MNASYHTSEKVTKHCRKGRTSRCSIVGVMVDVKTHAQFANEVDVRTRALFVDECYPTCELCEYVVR